MKTRKGFILKLVVGILISQFASIQPAFSGTDNDQANENAREINDTSTSSTTEKKITICHVPAGNTGNPLTISISKSAWHQERHYWGEHGGDYLGSCSSKITTPIAEPESSDLMIVTDSINPYKADLIKTIKKYAQDDYLSSAYLIINAKELSEKVKSSDSEAEELSAVVSLYLKDSAGNGDAEVHSDYLLVRADTTNSDYAGLVSAKASYDSVHPVTTPSYAIIPEDSLDDSNVYSEYKSCIDNDGYSCPSI